ncbi:2-C-methyl-D-erythritol 4-phosphate cytidylyltransferase [Dermacoccus nishinomiyaensis]|nr:2-C-methyl-D-erythritol 4-phosphate cytidylyltransferase [Dermacoccus nishinomiyaensis]
MTLRGAPLVTHAVRRILAGGGVSHVVVVTPATHESDFDEALAEFDPTLVTRVGGGAERSDSVRAGLAALDASCDAVLVHDAARCLAPPSLVARVLAALDDGADAVVPGVAVVDTIKLVEAREAQTVVASTPARAALRAIQTPQGFRRSALLAAHACGADATDDAALVELAGADVVVVAGDDLALKVTTPLDMVLAEHLLAADDAVAGEVTDTHPRGQS